MYKHRLTRKQSKQKIPEFYDDDFDLIEKHKGARTIGHIRGCTCPDCNVSKGEEKIAEWLEEHAFSFKREHRIKECRNVLPLPFDFAIFSKQDGKLKSLIEFDGPQHFFEMTGIYKGKLPEIKRHDEIKNNYCIRMGIPLLRIHFKNIDNIPEILNNHFFTEAPISLF